MSNKINNHQYEYVVLIDESGNAAYTKLSDGKGYGAEDFLNLGAVLVKKMKLKKLMNNLHILNLF